MRRFFNIALVAGFLIIIGLPLAANIAGQDGGDQEAENRDLAKFPTFEGTWKSVARSGRAVSISGSRITSDSGRRSCAGTARPRYFGLHVSPSSQVVRGKDGWLYYAEMAGGGFHQ